jgi:hypothetical protein
VASSPHAGAVDVQKPQGTRLHNSSVAPPSCALPPLLSPHFAPHCALLGYAVNTGSRNSEGVTWLPRHHAQQYTTLHSPSYQTPAFIGETEDSLASSVQVSVHIVSCNRNFKIVYNREFGVLGQLLARVLNSASVERRLMCETVTVCVLRSIVRRQLVKREILVRVQWWTVNYVNEGWHYIDCIWI